MVENRNSVDAGAHEIGKVVSFWPNFDANFIDIWRALKKQIIYIEKGWS